VAVVVLQARVLGKAQARVERERVVVGRVHVELHARHGALAALNGRGTRQHALHELPADAPAALARVHGERLDVHDAVEQIVLRQHGANHDLVVGPLALAAAPFFFVSFFFFFFVSRDEHRGVAELGLVAVNCAFVTQRRRLHGQHPEIELLDFTHERRRRMQQRDQLHTRTMSASSSSSSSCNSTAAPVVGGRAILCFPPHAAWFQGYFFPTTATRRGHHLALFGTELPVDACEMCPDGGFQRFGVEITDFSVRVDPSEREKRMAPTDWW
jgi:hypothetical protein